MFFLKVMYLILFLLCLIILVSKSKLAHSIQIKITLKNTEKGFCSVMDIIPLLLLKDDHKDDDHSRPYKIAL